TTLHEVERGLAPLGSSISVDYEFTVSARNPWLRDHEFGELQRRINAEIAKFTAKDIPPRPEGMSYRDRAFLRYTEESAPGLFLKRSRNINDRHIDVSLSPESTIFRKSGVVAQALFRAPFTISLWRKAPVLSNCKPSNHANLQFTMEDNPELVSNSGTQLPLP